jgi:hypothetical protein
MVAVSPRSRGISGQWRLCRAESNVCSQAASSSPGDGVRDFHVLVEIEVYVGGR